MTDQKCWNGIQDLICLVGCAVNGMTPNKERIQSMDLKQLYQASNRHLPAITAMALESAGVRDAAFTQAKGKAIRKLAAMDADMAAILRAFDDDGIWYMPLKGSVLKDYYPAYGMRQMSDRDILFDESRAGAVKSIMESNGFSCESFDKGVHDVYHKEPVSNFEMHRALFTSAFDRVFTTTT